MACCVLSVATCSSLRVADSLWLVVVRWLLFVVCALVVGLLWLLLMLVMCCVL